MAAFGYILRHNGVVQLAIIPQEAEDLVGHTAQLQRMCGRKPGQPSQCSAWNEAYDMKGSACQQAGQKPPCVTDFDYRDRLAQRQRLARAR